SCDKEAKDMEILVMGAGLVGETIALELGKAHSLLVIDSNPDRIKDLDGHQGIRGLVLSVTDKDGVRDLIHKVDLVVGALPGFLGYEALKMVLEEGKPAVDISFFPEDPFSLAKLAEEKHTFAIVDAGVAPGLSNLVAGFEHSKNPLASFTCYVGGLPKERKWPFQYKAPFSPLDVLEEYTRPARIRRQGRIITRPALSEQEILHFPKIGSLEAFLTDGLRTLLQTLDIPNMEEKTLRYPGHAALIQALNEAGFLDSKNLESGISPRKFTSQILKNCWKLDEQEEEFTIMKVLLEREQERIEYFLYDERDKETGYSSMSRTTGFTCIACVELVLEGKIQKTGILPLEILGQEGELALAIFQKLESKGISFQVQRKIK
ncbi:MAG: saccharopine dehydrogenase, partial [Planctomycetota bacterium]